MNCSPYKILIVSLICLFFLPTSVSADNLVILHTNDTHSHIYPSENGMGGVARRKALIDSVRNVHRNVLLVDAGDMVQGTLYFTLFGGEVESKLMNHLKYDIQILGNHEFDNGLKELYKVFGSLNAKKLSTNYDFTNTPLSEIFEPFIIKKFDGKKIGFIAINLDPKGMISDTNSEGIIYHDGVKAANATSWYLKHIEKVDMVVVISHIGYTSDSLISDVQIAKESEDIDIIIGGHSHTAINPAVESSPAYLIDNAVGKPVLVAQAGGVGHNVGEIVVDLDSFSKNYRLLPVDSRYDKYGDCGVDSIVAPYRNEVEQFRKFKIGKTKGMKKSDWSLVNWMADFVMHDAGMLTDEKVDLAIVNKGGVRADMQAGDVTKGVIMQIFPFENKVEVMKLSGDKLKEALDVMASRGGDGVSRGVDVVYDPETGKCVSVMINGLPLDPDRTYNVATLDYLARGGDYMAPLTEGKIIGSSGKFLYDDIIDTLKKHKYALQSDKKIRMHPEKK